MVWNLDEQDLRELSKRMVKRRPFIRNRMSSNFRGRNKAVTFNRTRRSEFTDKVRRGMCLWESFASSYVLSIIKIGLTLKFKDTSDINELTKRVYVPRSYNNKQYNAVLEEMNILLELGVIYETRKRLMDVPKLCFLCI